MSNLSKISEEQILGAMQEEFFALSAKLEPLLDEQAEAEQVAWHSANERGIARADADAALEAVLQRGDAHNELLYEIVDKIADTPATTCFGLAIKFSDLGLLQKPVSGRRDAAEAG
jgi:hypothetical protein